MFRLSTLLAAALLSTATHAAPLTEAIVANRLVILYRNSIPANAEAQVSAAGAHLNARIDRFNMIAVSTTAADAQTRLAAQPNVAAVLHDRYVAAHSIAFTPATTRYSIFEPPMRLLPPVALQPTSYPVVYLPAPTDTYYASPQGWAVQQSGGFGDNIPTAPTVVPVSGPWNISRGAGVRIAILDSGVDANHPDISPNLILNLSEINQSPATGLPSACDDGSPQDQTGHGTWTASLATGALGAGTGLVVGVAPQATLLSIKVLQRMPGIGTTPTAACEAGQAGGLLSWVLQGIDDAIANHADVVSLSLGTLVDLTTGDGAGWKAQFDAVTYAAAQSGTVIVAALGNDGLNLATGNLIELPAQARSVLPVVASTNPACAENLAANATCAPGPVTTPYYSNHGAAGAIAAPGGSYPEGSTTTPLTSTSGFIMGACSTGLTNTADGLPANGQSFGCFNLGHIQYVQAMGTSAAAPLVAGAAAILRAAHPTWTAAQIIVTLQTTATKLPTTSTPELNLPAALALN